MASTAVNLLLQLEMIELGIEKTHVVIICSRTVSTTIDGLHYTRLSDIPPCLVHQPLVYNDSRFD